MQENVANGKPITATRLRGVFEEFGENNDVVCVDKPQDVVGRAIELSLENRHLVLGRRAREFVET